MNICFFLSDLQVNGGIGRVTSIIAKRLSHEDNINVFCLCYYDTGTPLLYEMNDRIQVDYLLKERISITAALFHGMVGKLKKYLRNNNIDIAIGCGSMYTLPLILACKGINRTKCFFWDHTSPYVNCEIRFQKVTRMFNCIFSNRNIVLTKAAKQYYDKIVKSKKNIVIFNPVDPQIECSSNYRLDSKKIITVGRLSAQKNYPCLIEIASIICKNHPDWIWEIYGDGELREDIEHLIRDKSLEKQLILKGQVKNIYEIYKESSILVMTSAWEGFPMVLLEASANRLPMIAFDIYTGPNEIIEEGVNGYLVEFDNKEEMVNRIESLISNPEKRASFSDNSYLLSNRFDLESIVNEWRRVLE